MNSLVLALVAFVGYLIAYRVYGRYLATKIFCIDPASRTPAHELRDDQDYLPAKRSILFGHHFTSIAGTGPIVGPAIGIIWGWVPVFIWILLGPIFMGAVHDFGALVVSARNRGQSIGDVAGITISRRVRMAFLTIIFLLLMIVIAIFALVIASLFMLYPQAVLPVWLEVPIALMVGWAIYRKNVPTLPAGLVGLALMYATIVLGVYYPIKLPPDFLGIGPTVFWVLALMVYVYFASVLSVWRLLQPRDYINGHQLYTILAALFLGLIILQPTISAPAFQSSPPGAPPFLPFLFITVACGAISGFHSLVASGTSGKQLSNETDALPIGYGGMLLEGVLAVLVLIAVAAAIGDRSVWQSHYASWGAAAGLKPKLDAFVSGATNMLGAIGIPDAFAKGVLGVFVASFAGTTMDTATRLQRYVVSEMATTVKFRPLTGKHAATTFAVLTATALAFIPIEGQGPGSGGLVLWPLFGATNQLLGGLTLLVLTVYLIRRKTNSLVTAIPMTFMLVMTGWAMIHNLFIEISNGHWHLVAIGIIILALDIWMVAEAAIAVHRTRSESLGGIN